MVRDRAVVVLPHGAHAAAEVLEAAQVGRVAVPRALVGVYDCEPDVEDGHAGGVCDEGEDVLDAHCLDAVAAHVEGEVDGAEVGAVVERDLPAGDGRVRWRLFPADDREDVLDAVDGAADGARQGPGGERRQEDGQPEQGDARDGQGHRGLFKFGFERRVVEEEKCRRDPRQGVHLRRPADALSPPR